MLSQFEKKVAAFITPSPLIDSSESVLLAVSAGADSVAMMFAMLRLTQAGKIGARLVVGHVNHKLRQRDADQDEEFVVRLGKKLGIKVVVRSVDVNNYATESKLSIETAARKLRIGALIDIAKENACKSVATAHHKDDNAETMVHRLLRGTGFRGLAGIRPNKVLADEITFLRPLLCVTRARIIQYCRENDLDWRDDHTNQDVSYTRNYIRHLLLPQLQNACSGSLVEELAQLSQKCRSLHRRVCRNTEKVWPIVVSASQPDKITLDGKIFRAQTQIIQAELIRCTLIGLGSGERNLKAVHYRNIFALAQGPNGKRVELPGGFVAEAEYENVIFTSSKANGGPGSTSSPQERLTLQTDTFLNRPTALQIPGRTQFETCTIEATILDAKECELAAFKASKDPRVEWFDYDKLVGPVLVRRRQDGDTFWPLGGEGAKKIGKFLTAQKVPRRLRQKLLIIADGEKIIWLTTLRASELTKVTSRTKRILQLNIRTKAVHVIHRRGCG